METFADEPASESNELTRPDDEVTAVINFVKALNQKFPERNQSSASPTSQLIEQEYINEPIQVN